MRKLSFRTVGIIATLLAGLMVLPTPSHAQSWPQRPVKFVIPFGPGAGADIGARLLSERAKGEVVGGTYHITCAGEVSRFEFAQFLIKRVFMEPSSDRNVSEARPPRVVPITTEESGLSARRPKNSRLSCKKLYRNFGIALPHWSLVMDLYLDEIMFSERYGQ